MRQTETIEATAAGAQACCTMASLGGEGAVKDTRLLLEAFEMFNQASSSLEGAFQQLQERARRLSEELEAKNAALERSLRERDEVQAFLKTVLERLPCGVLVLDPSGDVTLCNPVAARILRQPTVPNGRSAGRRKRVLRHSALRKFFGRDDLEPPQARQEVEVPVLIGGGLRILSTSRTRLHDPDGTVSGSLHILRDVTELKALEEQGKRRERLAAMGEMAVELAHEIRNPLGSIELFASLLERELPLQSDAGRWAENIRMGSRSLNHIVSNMLHFAKPFTAVFSQVDVHSLIGEVLRFAEPIMRQRAVRLESDLKAERHGVRGDGELLKQMFLNLVLNAMQAMPAEGSLTIATRDVEEIPGGASCQGLEIRVRDTGMGIPPENLDRIFDPFFTTNKNGTGLGLSVVHHIVEQHSGFVRVCSELNAGTTFFVVLPALRLQGEPAGGCADER